MNWTYGLCQSFFKIYLNYTLTLTKKYVALLGNILLNGKYPDYYTI